jgi:hypothetical protein
LNFQCENPVKSTFVPFVDESIIASINVLASIFQSLDSTECCVKQTIENLTSIRAEYGENSEISLSSASFDGSKSSELLNLSNKIIQNSFEMVKNGGKFTKLIKDDANSMTDQNIVKPSLRSSPSSLRLEEHSRHAQASKPSKTSQPSTRRKALKVASTCYANCRIHQYDDDSHVFEIFDSADHKPRIIFVVLPSGETALFKSTSHKSTRNYRN